MASTLHARARLAGHAAVPKRLLKLRGDDALVALVRRGDEGAFEVLFDRYSDKIVSFCRHMLGSLEAAEDAAQQSFASAYSNLLRDERPIRFKPWLYTIARNRCLSVLRAAREEPTAEIDAEATGLAEEVAQRADLRALVSDLRDLPEDQRAALVLSEIGDMSHAEVGQVLGVEAGKVKGLVFRARSGLIERRDARDQPCPEVRERLANLRGGALRAGSLRHHLRACPGCTEYLEDVRRQRKMLAVALPVIPTAGFKNTALAAAGLSAGGGGIATGGFALSAAAVKVAAVVVVAAGAGVGAERVINPPESEQASPTAQQAAAKGAAAPPLGRAFGFGAADIQAAAAKTRRKSAHGEHGRSEGLNPAGRERGKSTLAPGQTKGGKGRDFAPGRTGTAPGKNGSPPGQVDRVKPVQPIKPAPQPQAVTPPAPKKVAPLLEAAPVAPQTKAKKLK